MADDRLVLTVRDDGRGLPADAQEGAGIRGMRERALLVDATIGVSDCDDADRAWWREVIGALATP